MRIDLIDKYEESIFKRQFPQTTLIIEQCVNECRSFFGYDRLSHAMIVCNEKEPKVKEITTKYNVPFNTIKQILES